MYNIYCSFPCDIHRAIDVSKLNCHFWKGKKLAYKKAYQNSKDSASRNDCLTQLSRIPCMAAGYHAILPATTLILHWQTLFVLAYSIQIEFLSFVNRGIFKNENLIDNVYFIANLNPKGHQMELSFNVNYYFVLFPA
jgi:hypothetical protein